MDALPKQKSEKPQGVGVVLNQDYKKKKVLLEIAFVIILLVLVLGILNYLNILPLSSFFPNQQSKQYKNVTTAPTAIPALSLTEKGKKTLISFLPTILDSTILATSTSGINFIKEEKTEGFTAYWNTKENSIVKTVFVPSASQNSIVSFNLAFHKTHSEAPSAKIAEALVPKAFLVTPKGEWNCANIADNPRLYCENFWEEENGIRRGVGLQGYHPDSTSKQSTVFFCEHTKESSLYSWKSCASEFAETGLQ